MSLPLWLKVQIARWTVEFLIATPESHTDKRKMFFQMLHQAASELNCSDQLSEADNEFIRKLKRLFSKEKEKPSLGTGLTNRTKERSNDQF